MHACDRYKLTFYSMMLIIAYVCYSNIPTQDTGVSMFCLAIYMHGMLNNTSLYILFQGMQKPWGDNPAKPTQHCHWVGFSPATWSVYSISIHAVKHTEAKTAAIHSQFRFKLTILKNYLQALNFELFILRVPIVGLVTEICLQQCVSINNKLDNKSLLSIANQREY